MKKNIFIVILVLIIVGLGGYLVYDKVIDKDTNENSVTRKKSKTEENKVYTYKELAGNYYFKTNANNDEIPELTIVFKLVLDERGTFNCVFAGMTPTGVLGNYIIDGNKVILNYTLQTGSGMGLNYIEGTKTLSIDNGDLNAIIGDEAAGSYVENIKGTKIVLKKNADPSNNEDVYPYNQVLKSNIEMYNEEASNN